MIEHDIDDAPIDDGENVGSNPSTEPSFGAVLAARLSRRAALRGIGAVLAAGAAGRILDAAPAAAQRHGPGSTTFTELATGLDGTDHVPEGYAREVVIRWGDKVMADAPAFDIARQSAAAQARQFGYNCDFLAFMPLPAGSAASDRGLLWVNHEYVNSNLMFAGLGIGRTARLKASAEQAAVEMAAHGGSIVELRRSEGKWATVDGPLNRRITVSTPMRIAGPAAGHARMQTAADPDGSTVLGMVNNCAGGTTPWGTILTCEENFNGYFMAADASGAEAALMKRYGITKEPWYSWWRYDDRFDMAKVKNESNRFGWVVEIDPYDPASMPVKRTALGRFKHECATSAISADGRVAFYSGDDERFDYVYRFVTARPWNPADRAANRDLLDEGTLSVARFEEDGKVRWLPLVFGEGPLTPANGFESQADVVIEARRAADLLKATPMDRPEDVEANPTTGRVYVMLTNNSRRKPEQAGGANPRADNRHGHVVEIVPPMRDGKPDHAAEEARWDIFLMGGKPGIDPGARYHRATTENGWLSAPDNCAFDSAGRIWISTDSGGEAGIADGVWVADTAGPGRALTRLFYQAPIGAEVCGPCFTPDEQTLFLAIQHPGEWTGSHFEKPATRWPDFDPAMPPRPSVVAITRIGGGKIGT